MLWKLDRCLPRPTPDQGLAGPNDPDLTCLGRQVSAAIGIKYGREKTINIILPNVIPAWSVQTTEQGYGHEDRTPDLLLKTGGPRRTGATPPHSGGVLTFLQISDVLSRAADEAIPPQSLPLSPLLERTIPKQLPSA